jgi:hypothetical protein
VGLGDPNCKLEPNKFIVPFVACGDLSGYDADQNYPLNVSHIGNAKMSIPDKDSWVGMFLTIRFWHLSNLPLTLLIISTFKRGEETK